ncbi:MAG: hypothetical protein ACI9UV_002541 [Algoriphagus sp.]|jgi:hypothetical protein
MKNLLLCLTAFLLSFTAFAQQNSDMKSTYFEVRKYYANDGKLQDLLNRFQNHTMKLFEKAGMENVAYFLPVDNTDNSMTYILGYPDEASRDKMWQSFMNDPEWKKAYEESHVNGPLVKSVVETFMVLAPHLNDNPKPMPSGAIQMRTYTLLDGKVPNIQARFRDHTQALFEKQGLRNYTYWMTVPKDGSQPKLLYLLGSKDQVSFEAGFQAFVKDPEWIKARDASEASGKIVEKVDAIMFKTLPFSPLK